MNDPEAERLALDGDGSWRQPARSDSSSGAIGCLVFIVVSGVLAIFASGSAFPNRPNAVPAPVAWTTREVTVSADRSPVHGRLTLTARTPPSGDWRIGLNAGVPSTVRPIGSPGPRTSTSAAGIDAPALLAGPQVRLTVGQGSGSRQTCFAPCELQMPPALRCDSGTCRTEFDVTVELVSSAGPSAINVQIAGGATAPIDKQLPDGTTVDLVLDSAAGPRGS